MPVEKISWENPKLPFLTPISWQCLTCGNVYIEVGIDHEFFHEKIKEPFWKKYAEYYGIKPTELLGPTPCRHFLAERYKERVWPFDSNKLRKKGLIK